MGFANDQRQQSLTMNEIIAILEPLRPILKTSEFRQLRVIIEAMLSMIGRITMLGISRWADKGGSYRTIQRFFNKPHDWSQMCWALIKHHQAEDPSPVTETPPVDKTAKVALLVGDSSVVTKSGKQTHGLDVFFSSTQNQPVKGLCFLTLSLIDVETASAYPLIGEQVIRVETKENVDKPSKQAKKEKGKAGRPKGSKNKGHTEVKLTPFQSQLQSCIRKAQGLLGNDVKLSHFAFDGELGHNNGYQLVKQLGLHLISKLRHDSNLYFPFTGDYAGKGAHRKYGDKVTVPRLEQETPCQDIVENNIRTRIYQIQAVHKKFTQKLNVVIILKTNLTTGHISKVLLFSDDLELPYDKLILYYQLRFQIEFNFRDAKQYWGLEDFMNTQEVAVNNAANLSFFMVTLSQLLMPKIKGLESGSVLDLKTVFRSRKYARRILNSIGIKSDEFLMDGKIFQDAEIGRIHKKAA